MKRFTALFCQEEQNETFPKLRRAGGDPAFFFSVSPTRKASVIPACAGMTKF